MSFVARRATLGQAVLLELVAKLPERHSEQLGGLRLNTAGAIQSPLEVAPLEIVQRGLEVEALLRNVDQLRPAGRALASHRLGQRIGVQHVGCAQHDGCLLYTSPSPR